MLTRAAKNPDNPEAQHLIGSTYWDKACAEMRPTCAATAPKSDAVKVKYVEAGLEAENKALALRGDYIEALVYKGLLLRSQAALERKDAARYKDLMTQAEGILAQVAEIRKKQQGQPTAKNAPGAKKGE